MSAADRAPGASHSFDLVLGPADVGWMGHVSAEAYLAHSQKAHLALLGGGADRPAFVVAEHEIRYRRALTRTPARVATRILRTGRSTVVLDSDILDDDTVYATVRTTWVAVDPGTGGSRPLTDAERVRLGGWAVAPAGRAV